MHFPSTIWTQIKSAGSGDRRALEDLFRKYQPAVVTFARSEGLSAPDAEDVAQEVFQAICDAKFLRKVDPAKGKFRSLVLAVTRNLILMQKRELAAQKRGGNARLVSVEELHGQGFEVEDLKDERFDNFWVQTLVARGMELLKQECAERGTPFYKAMVLFVSGEPYTDVAEKLDVSAAQVKSYIHQARSKLKRFVGGLIKEYSASNDDYRRELKYLLKFLRN